MLGWEPAVEEALRGVCSRPVLAAVLGSHLANPLSGDLRLRRGREARRQRRAVCLAKPSWLLANTRLDHPPGPKFLGHGEQPVASCPGRWETDAQCHGVGMEGEMEVAGGFKSAPLLPGRAGSSPA